MLNRISDLTVRQALALVIASSVLLVLLVILWLTVSTQTALLSNQLDILDASQIQLSQEINLLWRSIGDVTSPQIMEQRARRAGFVTPDQIEFLLSTKVTATVVPTISITTTPGN